MVMEWMATITGDHVGYPGFGGFFSKKEKNLGEVNYVYGGGPLYRTLMKSAKNLSVFNDFEQKSYFFDN